FHETWEFRDTGRAPAGPDIHQDDLAPEVLEVQRISLEVDQMPGLVVQAGPLVGIHHIGTDEPTGLPLDPYPKVKAQWGEQNQTNGDDPKGIAQLLSGKFHILIQRSVGPTGHIPSWCSSPKCPVGPPGCSPLCPRDKRMGQSPGERGSFPR